MKFDHEAVARGVMAFVSTLRNTAGLTKQEVKNALHPKMIDMIWKIEDSRANKEQKP
jgi:hypothetical protein